MHPVKRLTQDVRMEAFAALESGVPQGKGMPVPVP